MVPIVFAGDRFEQPWRDCAFWFLLLPNTQPTHSSILFRPTTVYDSVTASAAPTAFVTGAALAVACFVCAHAVVVPPLPKHHLSLYAAFAFMVFSTLAARLLAMPQLPATARDLSSLPFNCAAFVRARPTAFVR